MSLKGKANEPTSEEAIEKVISFRISQVGYDEIRRLSTEQNKKPGELVRDVVMRFINGGDPQHLVDRSKKIEDKLEELLKLQRASAIVSEKIEKGVEETKSEIGSSKTEVMKFVRFVGIEILYRLIHVSNMVSFISSSAWGRQMFSNKEDFQNWLSTNLRKGLLDLLKFFDRQKGIEEKILEEGREEERGQGRGGVFKGNSTVAVEEVDIDIPF